MVLMKMEEVEVAMMKMEKVVVVFLQEKLHRLNLKNLWGYLPPEANNRDLHLHLHLLQMEVHPNSEFHRQHRNLVLEILELIFFPHSGCYWSEEVFSYLIFTLAPRT